MKTRIVPAILSGGSGTRLWPLSRPERPKQFLRLGGVETLFEATLARNRASRVLSFSEPLVLCSEKHIHLARASLGRRNARYVVEPLARNTAPIAAVAAALVCEQHPDALVLLQPADHIVEHVEAFHEAVARARDLARERIVTFGVTPTRSATEYGYIRRGAVLGPDLYAISAFKEKPDAATAEAYLTTGEYVWNAGIFLFDPAVLLREFRHSAEVRDAALLALKRAHRLGDEVILDAATFAQAPSTPLDVAVMEKTDLGAVVACDIGWTDIGSWREVWRIAMEKAGDELVPLGAVASTDVSRIRESGVPALAIDGDDLVALATRFGIVIVPREQLERRPSEVLALAERAN